MGHRGHYGKGPHTPSDFPANEKEQNAIGPDDTVYRYLCPLRKIGSIIGIGGDIARQLRAQTHAKIRIRETIPGCDERVVTIYSPREETNIYEDEPVCPAMDALFRVHDKVVAEDSPPVNGSFEETMQVVVRLLVPSDQIGCVIGKGGQIIQGIRNETHAQVRILGSEHLPVFALSSDQIIQINGEVSVVKEALYQVALCLHDNPSRSQHSLLSSPSIYKSGISLNSQHAGPTSLMGPYIGSHKLDTSSIPREFMVRLVCPTENLGAVIGKGGATIKQIRQETGAFIVVDSNGADGDDCIISVSSKEMPEAPSRTVDAIIRLLPRCSVRVEQDSGEPVITTRLLVPSQNVGCIIGKGGAIIKEMRSISRANIRIFDDENVPKVASEDDEVVQITGDFNAAKNALLQVIQRLRANTFETGANLPVFPKDTFSGHKYVNRDNRTHNSGYSAYSGGYGSKNLAPTESNDSYDESQIESGSGYRAYGIYSSGVHSTGTGYGA